MRFNRHFFARSIVFLFAVATLTACSTLPNNPYRISQLTTHDKEKKENGEILVFGKWGLIGFRDKDLSKTRVNLISKAYTDAYTLSKKCYDDAKPPPSEGDCRNARDTLINAYITASNDTCASHLANIQANAATFNVSLGTVTNVTSSMATFIGGEAARQALSGAAAISNASRSLINEEFFLQQLGPVITKTIRDDRTAKLAIIVAGMGSSSTEYKIDKAILDISEYHDSCSFLRGLEQLTDASKSRESISGAEIDKTIEALNVRLNSLEEKRQKLKSGADVVPDDKRVKSLEDQIEIVNNQIKSKYDLMYSIR